MTEESELEGLDSLFITDSSEIEVKPVITRPNKKKLPKKVPKKVGITTGISKKLPDPEDDSWLKVQNQVLLDEIRKFKKVFEGYQEPNLTNNKHIKELDLKLTNSLDKISELQEQINKSSEKLTSNDHKTVNIPKQDINLENLNYYELLEDVKEPKSEIEKELHVFCFKQSGKYRNANQNRYKKIIFLTTEIHKLRLNRLKK